MPKQIDKLKKAKYKRARLQGKSISKSMLVAGSTPATAHNSTNEAYVKICEEEIRKEFLLSDVTPEFVIKNLVEDRALALKKKDYSTVVRVDELLGKYIALWTDKVKNEIAFTPDDQRLLKMYDRIKAFKPEVKN